MASVPETTVLFRLDQGHCRDLEHSLGLEWLETDGLGGYASSTVPFCPTRRYHGLLVGYPEGSSKRHVFLSRFEETVRADDAETPLSSARYSDTWSPAGHSNLVSFELAPWPTSVYRSPLGEVTREVLQVRGEGVTLSRYSLRGAKAATRLELRPFLPYREADALTVENGELDPDAERLPKGIRCRPYAGLPALSITVGQGKPAFEAEPLWYRGLDYTADRRRGYPSSEDQFTPGVLRIPFASDGSIVVAATTGAAVENPEALWKKETTRRARLTKGFAKAATPAHFRSALAAEDFLYRSPTGRLGVNAGYPWFVEWGRDTFIALPGLTLARGQLKECGQALTGALEYLQDGLLPNVYGRTKADCHYGSADAALWFARAVQLYEMAGVTSSRIAKDFLPALEEIAGAYLDGTALGLKAEDGLLHAGSSELNATWMDARTPQGPVTPRKGFPVEINALWYSLLEHLEHLHGHHGTAKAKKKWTALRREAKRNFLARFWKQDEKRLIDVWDSESPDESIRPNMVIAAALEYSPLTRAQREGVVLCAREHLLTDRGLRTLSPEDDAYVPRYEGGPEERDAAYHQGTVWPWLLGFYCEASLRAFGSRKSERRALLRLWGVLEGELDRAGLGHMSEVFDGDEPRTPGGTIAQAWNTAEYLRASALLSKSRR